MGKYKDAVDISKWGAATTVADPAPMQDKLYDVDLGRSNANELRKINSFQSSVKTTFSSLVGKCISHICSAPF